MKILFVGNSHTYMNGLPFLVRETINAGGGNALCEAHMVTTGGRSLGWHAAETGTRMSIMCQPWDVIVLQDQTHPFLGYAALREAYQKLAAPLAHAGAEVLLYVTWSRKGAPGDQAALDEAFETLSRETGARLVPVSRAWHRILREAPEIELYAPDGGHAAPAGSYLAACVFYAVLTGKSPVGLPACIEANGVRLVELTAAAAARLQAAAAASV